MVQSENYLAVDLGAESGRTILGKFSGEKLEIETIHRFPNTPVTVLNSLYWDILKLFAEIKHGLSKASEKTNGNLNGIGIDTWGLDFALLGEDDILLANPYHYRDSRTTGIPEKVFQKIDQKEIFAETGVQFMQINTLYQLYCFSLTHPKLLHSAKTMLTIPDLLNFWLTGEKVCERTNASTTQFYNPTTKSWSKRIFPALDLPLVILPRIVPPGTTLAPLLPNIAEETGLTAYINRKGRKSSRISVPVIAPACHDTASAIASVPATENDYLYISSGTWSLLGVELKEPLINDTVLKNKFSNEAGVDDSTCLLTNIMGLWLIQQCKSEWEKRGNHYSYSDMIRLALQANPFQAVINVDDHNFLTPGDMPRKIINYCTRTGQKVQLNYSDTGTITRIALEGLALRYRWAVERCENIIGKKLPTIHIVGGGTKNKLLCQMTADACNKTVVTGPVEATAIGSILMQMLSRQVISNLKEGRQIVRDSFPLKIYQPENTEQWEESYQRFLTLL